MKHFSVNPKAESIADVVTKIVLSVHILVAVALIIFSVVAFVDYRDENGIILLFVSIFVAIVGVICWASLKMIVNVSRTLYNIEDDLQQLTKITDNNHYSWISDKNKQENKNTKNSKEKDVRCPDCGELIINVEDDCPNCGCPSSILKGTSLETMTPELVVCPNCGKKYSRHAEYCPECALSFQEAKHQND